MWIANVNWNGISLNDFIALYLIEYLIGDRYAIILVKVLLRTRTVFDWCIHTVKISDSLYLCLKLNRLRFDYQLISPFYFETKWWWKYILKSSFSLMLAETMCYAKLNIPSHFTKRCMFYDDSIRFSLSTSSLNIVWSYIKLAGPINERLFCVFIFHSYVRTWKQAAAASTATAVASTTVTALKAVPHCIRSQSIMYNA